MDWFTTDWEVVFKIVLTTAGVMCAVIFCIRINGLRTLSKMSSFDFAVTVAVGSTVASTILSSKPALLEGVVALAALIAFQRVVAEFRVRFGASEYVDNEPLLLMAGEQFNQAALLKARVTEEDIMGKLREANVLKLADVRAVVLESTGDISVLHGSSDKSIDERIMRDVKGFGSSSQDITTVKR